MTVIVVGAGIAGLACARELLDAGVPVRVLERGPEVGGRLASARCDGRYADVGAAYLTAGDPAFAGRLATWRIDGLARPWTDTFAVYRGDGSRAEDTTGPMRWSAPGGLRSLAVDLARELDVTLNYEVTALPAAAAVVLAMPGPQARRIADLPAARRQRWSPAVTAVLTYPERGWPDFHGAFVNGHPVLATVCDDGDRRGDRAPVLVAHSTAEFARRHERDPQAAGPELNKAVEDLFGVRAISTRVHYWPYATPEPPAGFSGFSAPSEGPGAGSRPSYARHGDVYLAGDAFGHPRVQTAWLSGRAAARAILKNHKTER